MKKISLSFPAFFNMLFEHLRKFISLNGTHAASQAEPLIYWSFAAEMCSIVLVDCTTLFFEQHCSVCLCSSNSRIKGNNSLRPDMWEYPIFWFKRNKWLETYSLHELFNQLQPESLIKGSVIVWIGLLFHWKIARYTETTSVKMRFKVITKSLPSSKNSTCLHRLSKM